MKRCLWVIILGLAWSAAWGWSALAGAAPDGGVPLGEAAGQGELAVPEQRLVTRGAPTVVQVPGELHRLYQQALGNSPRVQALERQWDLAQSRQRASVAELERSTGLTAYVLGREEGSHRGIGSAIQWALREPIGSSEVLFSIGPGVAQKFGRTELEAAPVVSLGIRHPLRKGPDVRRAKADYELAVAEQRYRADLAAFQRELVQSYGRLEAAKREREAARIRLRLAERGLQALEARAQHGDAPLLALYEARQRHSEALNAWELAQLAVEEAALAVTLLTGVEVAEGLTPGAAESGAPAPEGELAEDEEVSVGFAPDLPPLAPLEQWLLWAWMDREDWQLAEEKVAIAEAELEAARQRRGWSGDLTVRANYPDPDSFPGNEARRARWRVGVELQMPLKAAASEEALVQAELRLEEARAELELVERQVEAEVTTAFHQVERAQRRLERAERQREQAQWLLEIAREKVDAGLETEEALWEAKLAAAEAERALVEAKYDLLAQVISLWQAAGRDATW